MLHMKLYLYILEIGKAIIYYRQSNILYILETDKAIIYYMQGYILYESKTNYKVYSKQIYNVTVISAYYTNFN